MTKKQFWMKLDQMAGKADKLMEFIQVLRKGYDEDLAVLIACHHLGYGGVGQMYVNLDQKDPERVYGMEFADIDLARDLFDGKVNAVACIGEGKIEMKGMINMIDNLNRILDRVALYLA